MRLLRPVLLFALWGALGAVVGVTAITSLAFPLGYRTYNVLSGSMEPTLPVGGVVVNETIEAHDARPGNVITFRDPDGPGRLITHRLRRAELRGGRAYMVTQGDANDAPEEWNVPRDGQIGRVVAQAPWLGYVRVWIASRYGRLVVLLAVVCWGALACWHLWRPARPDAPSTPTRTMDAGMSS